MDADTLENIALRAQLATIFRTSSQAYISASQLALQQADLIQSGRPITAQDIATMTLQLPLIMPIVGLGAGSSSKGKKGKAESSSVADLFRHHPSSAVLPDLHATGATAADGTRKRKRAPAKPRDPNAPKRPPSAYLIYQNELRKEVKEKHPEMTYPEVLQEIAKLWQGLEEKEKKPYLDATELAKKEYEKAKAEYEKAHPAGAATAGDGDTMHIGDGVPTDEASSVAEGDSPVPVVSKTKGRPSAAGKASASKVVEKKKGGKTSLAPAPPVMQSGDSDDTGEGDEEEEEEEEAKPPPKKSKKDKTAPPAPSSSKKEKKRK